MSLGMLSIELENFGMNYINRRSLSVKCSKAQHTLYDATQFEHDNNKKDENESVVA